MWCTAEKRFMWHVCRRNPFRLFFLAKTFNSWRHQKVGEGELLSWESQSSSNIASDGFELFFAVHFLYPKFVLPGSKQLMPVTVKFKIDVLVCGLQGRLFPPFNVSPMFPCSQNVMHCRKEVYVTCLSKESIPAILPCKDIQLMKTSESRWGWIIELGVTIQLEHRQWWIRIIFRPTFSVPKICPPWFQATHACHSEV